MPGLSDELRGNCHSFSFACASPDARSANRPMPASGRQHPPEVYYFLQDVPKDVVEEGAAHERRQPKIAFSDPAIFQAWPNIPISPGL
jgi:hypothetical protein